jgi:pyruvate/2-oxoglutarate dehydrogenase complex dihydrolipoamide acyltransferase (E2) component
VRVVLAVLVLAAFAAQAQPLYKWTDAEGKVHYGDRIPKGFKGPVERVDTEAPAGAVPPSAPVAPTAPAAAPAPKPPAAKPESMMETAGRRRATRERLQAAVDAARERLAEAEAALKAGEAPGDEERQVIQQVAGAPGSLPASGRSNCRKTTNAQGKEVTMCPALIPNPQYYDRIKGLEDAVKAAQLELDRAREAYRRGVD